jgi:hypothetical protein
MTIDNGSSEGEYRWFRSTLVGFDVEAGGGRGGAGDDPACGLAEEYCLHGLDDDMLCCCFVRV